MCTRTDIIQFYSLRLAAKITSLVVCDRCSWTNKGEKTILLFTEYIEEHRSGALLFLFQDRRINVASRACSALLRVFSLESRPLKNKYNYRLKQLYRYRKVSTPREI